MTSIPAKVLTVEKLRTQYQILLQIELDRYLDPFYTLSAGESKPFCGACHYGRVELFYYRDAGVGKGKPAFPLWTIQRLQDGRRRYGLL